VDEPVRPDDHLCAKEEGAVMQKRRNFRRLALAGAVAAVMGGSSAIAQEHRGTMEQQMACTPDVFRLCGAAIPDENRIVACLQANTPQLSGPCRAVFESNDSINGPPPRTSPQPVQAPVRRGYQYQ
jgi:hypothetical protein